VRRQSCGTSLYPARFAAATPGVGHTCGMIAAHGLTKTFADPGRGPVMAVDGVSFECRPGEVYGLLGGNGAGKTTTLRMLATLLKPTAGAATVAGCDVRADPAGVRQRLGFLSANTGLYDRMTAWEHVEHFARLHGLGGEVLGERMHRVFAALRMFDIRDKLVSRLSTGLRQKVSIARAIVHDPPALVFDEPTLGLDVLVARSVMETVERLRDAGKAIVYSTHYLREVERLCARVGMMHRGRMLDQGPLPELLDRHRAKDLEGMFFGLVDRADGTRSW
jgi:sodium transport system ATP-binding protein